MLKLFRRPFKARFIAGGLVAAAQGTSLLIQLEYSGDASSSGVANSTSPIPYPAE